MHKWCIGGRSECAVEQCGCFAAGYVVNRLVVDETDARLRHYGAAKGAFWTVESASRKLMQRLVVGGLEHADVSTLDLFQIINGYVDVCPAVERFGNIGIMRTEPYKNVAALADIDDLARIEKKIHAAENVERTSAGIRDEIFDQQLRTLRSLHLQPPPDLTILTMVELPGIKPGAEGLKSRASRQRQPLLKRSGVSAKMPP